MRASVCAVGAGARRAARLGAGQRAHALRPSRGWFRPTTQLRVAVPPRSCCPAHSPRGRMGNAHRCDSLVRRQPTRGRRWTPSTRCGGEQPGVARTTARTTTAQRGLRQRRPRARARVHDLAAAGRAVRRVCGASVVAATRAHTRRWDRGAAPAPRCGARLYPRRWAGRARACARQCALRRTCCASQRAAAARPSVVGRGESHAEWQQQADRQWTVVDAGGGWWLRWPLVGGPHRRAASPGLDVEPAVDL
jgi:hypothetical protein